MRLSQHMQPRVIELPVCEVGVVESLSDGSTRGSKTEEHLQATIATSTSTLL
jgi:hypothetical protein